MARAANYGIVSAESRSQLGKPALDAHFFFSVGSCRSNPVFPWWNPLLSHISTVLVTCELCMGPLGCICLITPRRPILDLVKDRDGGAAWAASRFRDGRPSWYLSRVIFSIDRSYHRLWRDPQIASKTGKAASSPVSGALVLATRREHLHPCGANTRKHG